MKTKRRCDTTNYIKQVTVKPVPAKPNKVLVQVEAYHGDDQDMLENPDKYWKNQLHRVGLMLSSQFLRQLADIVQGQPERVTDCVISFRADGLYSAMLTLERSCPSTND